MRPNDLALGFVAMKFAAPLVFAAAWSRTAFQHVAVTLAWVFVASIVGEFALVALRRRLAARFQAELDALPPNAIDAGADADALRITQVETQVADALDAGRLDDVRALLREFFEEEREQVYDVAALRSMTDDDRELAAEAEADFATVLEMVDAPPEPTPQLVELLKRAGDDPGAP